MQENEAADDDKRRQDELIQFEAKQKEKEDKEEEAAGASGSSGASGASGAITRRQK